MGTKKKKNSNKYTPFMPLWAYLIRFYTILRFLYKVTINSHLCLLFCCYFSFSSYLLHKHHHHIIHIREIFSSLHPHYIHIYLLLFLLLCSEAMRVLREFLLLIQPSVRLKSFLLHFNIHYQRKRDLLKQNAKCIITHSGRCHI